MLTQSRIAKVIRQLMDARERAFAARRQGDQSGYLYARAEATRLARIIAEG